MRDKKKLILALALVFALNILLISVFQNAEAVTYKRGSSGSVVSQIQQRLKTWGYYGYAVDGIYNSRTETAVKAFQQKNSLKADGASGPATLAAMGIKSSSVTAGTSANVNLLARLISAEAGGEPYRGQVAVGAVVLNRMKHPSFPGTISGVIYQPGAFRCISDGQFNEPVAESAYRAARDALLGVDPSGGALYYFNPSKATNQWIQSRSLITEIGNHRFCA